MIIIGIGMELFLMLIWVEVLIKTLNKIWRLKILIPQNIIF